MKKLIVAMVSLIATTFAFGQRLEVGETQFNAGVGFNSGNYWDVPVYVGVEYGIFPDITVGGTLSYATANYNYGVYTNKGKWFSIGARGDYHFNTLLSIPDNWDLYAGATLAYNNFTYDNDWAEGHGKYDNSGLGLGLQIGGRYYFNENWAINLEFNGNDVVSGGRIGVTYKF